jgi:hypothetical protein
LLYWFGFFPVVVHLPGSLFGRFFCPGCIQLIVLVVVAEALWQSFLWKCAGYRCINYRTDFYSSLKKQNSLKVWTVLRLSRFLQIRVTANF